MTTRKPEDLIAHTGRDVPPSGIREFFDIVYSTPDAISLGVGEPDFTTPWRISDCGIFAIKDGYTHYTPNRGLPDLRTEVSKYLKSHYSIEFNPNSELIITLGVSQALDLALRSIINPGDEVIIVEPCYVSYAANVQMLHGTPVIISTDIDNGFRLKVEDLEKAITSKTKALLLNYPSNPTGATLDKETLEAIAVLAKKHNFIVISDEIYSAITYDTDHTSMAILEGMKERTIYLNGFSKSHAMTGWRLGFVAGPTYLIDIMLKIHQYTALCAPAMAQYAAVEALSHGDRDVRDMKMEYRRRRNFIVDRFNETGLRCLEPEGAFYVFPDISSTGMNARQFALTLLEKEKVAVVPGTAFGNSGEGHIRCSFATSMDNIREAMKRIDRFVSQLR